MVYGRKEIGDANIRTDRGKKISKQHSVKVSYGMLSVFKDWKENVNRAGRELGSLKINTHLNQKLDEHEKGWHAWTAIGAPRGEAATETGMEPKGTVFWSLWGSMECFNGCAVEVT